MRREQGARIGYALGAWLANPVDRRRVLVQLTPTGDRVADEAARSYQAGRERVLDRLLASIQRADDGYGTPGSISVPIWQMVV